MRATQFIIPFVCMLCISFAGCKKYERTNPDDRLNPDNNGMVMLRTSQVYKDAYFFWSGTWYAMPDAKLVNLGGIPTGDLLLILSYPASNTYRKLTSDTMWMVPSLGTGGSKVIEPKVEFSNGALKDGQTFTLMLRVIQSGTGTEWKFPLDYTVKLID